MNQPTISREQARELDRRAVEEFGLPSIVLMENAGRGVADTLCTLGIAGRVVICCGGGNNGGDGFVVARHLDLRGHDVLVLLAADPGRLQGDAQINFAVLRESGVPMRQIEPGEIDQQLRGSAWVVDALLGTGARGEPRAALADIIDRINHVANSDEASARQCPSVLAIDLPSGLDCDTGQAAGHTIRADHTCTFVARKPGLLAQGADQYTGIIHVIDIGSPRKLRDEVLGLSRQ